MRPSDGTSLTTSYSGRVHSPMDDQENLGQQRQVAVKGFAHGRPAAKHATGKAANGYAAGAARRSQRAAKPIRPKWNGSIAQPPSQDPMQAARATVRDSIHGFRRFHGGWASNTPQVARPAAVQAQAQPAVRASTATSAAASADCHPAAAAESGLHRRAAVQEVVSASGMGCGSALALQGAPLAPGNHWTTRSQRREMCSDCTLVLRRKQHTDVIVRVVFADLETTPARVRISHARSEPSAAAGYSLLGEAALAAGKAGKLAHSLRLGPDRRVGRYLRLEFSGHLVPEAQSGAHKVAKLEVTGEPFDHADPKELDPAARRSVPELRRSAASVNAHPAATGAPDDAKVTRRRGGRRVAAAFESLDALDAALRQFEAGLSAAEEAQLAEDIAVPVSTQLAAVAPPPRPMAEQGAERSPPRNSVAAESMALVPAAGVEQHLAVTVQQPPPQQQPEPQPPADSPVVIAAGRHPGGSPTAVLSRADAAAALRRLVGGRAGGTSITASLNLPDTAEGAAPLQQQQPPPPGLPAPPAYKPSLLDQRLALYGAKPPAAQDRQVERHQLAEALAGDAQGLGQQQHAAEEEQPALSSAALLMSPPPAEAIDDEGVSEKQAAAQPQPLAEAEAVSPHMQAPPPPSQQLQPATPPSVHPVAAVLREALSAPQVSSPAASPLQPWMLDAMSGLAPANANKGKILFDDLGSPPPAAREETATCGVHSSPPRQALSPVQLPAVSEFSESQQQEQQNVGPATQDVEPQPSTPAAAPLGASTKRSWRSPSPTSTPLFTFDNSAAAAHRELKRPKVDSPEAGDASLQQALPAAVAVVPPAPPPPPIMCDTPPSSPDASAEEARVSRRPDWCAASSGGSLGWAAGAPGLDLPGAMGDQPQMQPNTTPQTLDFGGAGAASSPTPKRVVPQLLNQQLWASIDSPDEETPYGMAALQHSLARSASRERSWEPSPFTWDSVKIAPTPGYHLTERPPEALGPAADSDQQPLPPALPQAQQSKPLAPEVTTCSPADADDPFVEHGPQQQRQTVASAASGANTASSVRSTPPVDLLPKPAHAKASPTLRTLPPEAPLPPARQEFGRELRSAASSFQHTSTPPDVAFMQPMGKALKPPAARRAGVLHPTMNTAAHADGPLSAESRRSAATSPAAPSSRAMSSVRSSSRAPSSARSFRGFGGSAVGVVTLTPPQVAASPAVSASSATVTASAASAEGLHLTAAPTLQHGRAARHRRARDAPPALSTVPEVPSATYLAPAPSSTEAHGPGGESPLELRMMRPLGTALRAATGLLGSGELQVLTPSPDLPILAAASRAEFGADGPRISVLAASAVTPPDAHLLRPLGAGIRRGGLNEVAGTRSAPASPTHGHHAQWQQDCVPAGLRLVDDVATRHHCSDPGALAAAASPVAKPLGHAMKRSGVFGGPVALPADDITPQQHKPQVLRPWKGVRTQKRLSVAALRSPTDFVAWTPGAGLRSSMRRSGMGMTGTPRVSVPRSLRRSAGRFGSRASLRSGIRTQEGDARERPAAMAALTPVMTREQQQRGDEQWQQDAERLRPQQHQVMAPLPMYGSFTQPAGLDTAADLQQFGSPAIPGGALGAGLDGLNELLAQSPACRLLGPRHATAITAAERQAARHTLHADMAAAGAEVATPEVHRHGGQRGEPLPLPTARKLAARPNAAAQPAPAVSPDSIGKALARAAAAMVMPADHASGSQRQQADAAAAREQRRSWGSESGGGSSSSGGRRRLWRRQSASPPEHAQPPPRGVLHQPAAQELSPPSCVTTLVYTQPSQTETSGSSGGSRKRWRRFLMGKS